MTTLLSLVAEMVIIRTILTVVDIQNWILFPIYIYNTFIQGHLQEEIRMNVLQGFSKQREHQNLVCKLLKFLYGFKQTSNICILNS